MSDAIQIALFILIVQAAPTPAPPVTPTPAPPADDATVTVIENARVLEAVPINSRIERVQADNIADEPAAAMYLREWADCVVRIYRPQSLALLATPLNSPAQTSLVNQLTGNRFTRRTVCARFRTMRVDNLVLRGAVAEALSRWEDRRRRTAGPLVPAAPPAAAGSPAQLAIMGRCAVERDAAGVARVMATRPGTGAARRAIAGLSATIDACMPAGIHRRDTHPLALRAALGEPFYISRREAASRASAAAMRPST